MMNNARRDSHLDLFDVGGVWVNVNRLDELEAPIRFLPDYGAPVGIYAFFVRGYDRSGLDGEPAIGDRLLEINDTLIHCVVRRLELYYRSSSYYQSMWNTRRGLGS